MTAKPETSHLHRTLTAPKLWALMVGMVISGQYFGWNYGIAHVSGLINFFIAVFFVIVFYVGLTLSCAELAGFIPSSGGPSAYATRAFGKTAGLFAGIACLLEFLCAVPAIAISLGDYVHVLLPTVSAKLVSVLAVMLVLLINATKVERMAQIELIATVLALLGLVLYYLFSAHALMHVHSHSLSGALSGRDIVAALPFAIWLFLAIEGGVMTAEEMRDPKKTLIQGFIAALLTLIVCTVLTVSFTTLLRGHAASATDAPLLKTLMSLHVPGSGWVAAAVAVLGAFGLFASLNGITLAYSRQVFAMSRSGFLPRFLMRLSNSDVPLYALMVPGCVVLVLVLLASVAQFMVTLSVLGAMIMYLFVFASLFKLRRLESHAARVLKVNGFLVLMSLLLSVLFIASIVRSVVVQAF